jgi:hypothetical protein
MSVETRQPFPSGAFLVLRSTSTASRHNTKLVINSGTT